MLLWFFLMSVCVCVCFKHLFYLVLCNDRTNALVIEKVTGLRFDKKKHVQGFLFIKKAKNFKLIETKKSLQQKKKLLVIC